jgi:hypothetical protein
VATNRVFVPVGTADRVERGTNAKEVGTQHKIDRRCNSVFILNSLVYPLVRLASFLSFCLEHKIKATKDKQERPDTSRRMWGMVDAVETDLIRFDDSCFDYEFCADR